MGGGLLPMESKVKKGREEKEENKQDRLQLITEVLLEMTWRALRQCFNFFFLKLASRRTNTFPLVGLGSKRIRICVTSRPSKETEVKKDVTPTPSVTVGHTGQEAVNTPTKTSQGTNTSGRTAPVTQTSTTIKKDRCFILTQPSEPHSHKI